MMKLNLSEHFMRLFEQLAYIDHDKRTDVTFELMEVISHARAEGLSITEIHEITQDRANLLKQRGQIVDDEHQELVDQFLAELPSELANT